MIVDEIKLELEKYSNKADVLRIWYIKEYLQTIILKEIYEFPDCKDNLFYWWTSLRFLFWLNRLSEDLDFLNPNFNNFEGLWEFLQHRLKNYWLVIDYKIQKFRLTLKFRNLLSEFNIKYGNSNDLYIKVEISANDSPLEKFTVKLYPIFKHNQSLVLKSFDEHSLFATKLNAVLYRKREKKWENTFLSVKWRDFYDLFWYLQRWTKPNINCIQWIQDINELKEKLIEIVKNTDFTQVELDIRNFVEDQNIIDFIKTNWKEYILEQLNNW